VSAAESTEGPQDGRVGPGPYAALFGGQGADIATTLMGRSRGMRETNPLGFGGVMAGKAALMTLGPLLMRKLAKQGHPTAAKVMGYGMGAAGAVPAVMNARTLAR
ncbi:MAG: hypothetical protein NUW01_19900, partial [Gemmatimonadaceae bacterium]|nr:hypothetical protein [Gemmatimonadaceae bacterium]